MISESSTSQKLFDIFFFEKGTVTPKETKDYQLTMHRKVSWVIYFQGLQLVPGQVSNRTILHLGFLAGRLMALLIHRAGAGARRWWDIKALQGHGFFYGINQCFVKIKTHGLWSWNWSWNYLLLWCKVIFFMFNKYDDGKKTPNLCVWLHTSCFPVFYWHITIIVILLRRKPLQDRDPIWSSAEVLNMNMTLILQQRTSK